MEIVGFYNGIEIKKILDKYLELGNVWETGKIFGIKGQQVHRITTKFGVQKKMNYFTDLDRQFLLDNYYEYRCNQNLSELAKILGRTKPFINRQAKKLGLTNKCKSDLIFTEERRCSISKQVKDYQNKNGHPKGMLGKTHTEEHKKVMKQKGKERAKLGLFYTQQEANRNELSERMHKLQKEGKLNREHKNTNQGWATIKDKKIFLRSSWEYNIAILLQHKKDNGLILEWEYEPFCFDFKDKSNGILSYTPDFKITNIDKSFYFIEVKGWFSDKSKIKINKFRNEYNKIKLEVIDEIEYKKIEKEYKTLDGWGFFTNMKDYKKCEIDGCDNKSHSKGLCRKHFYLKYKK